MKKGTNKRVLFTVTSWTVFVIGLILVGYDLYGLIFRGENLTANFVTGVTLIYEGLKIATGEIPEKT